jgi:hypothetical protein
MHTMFREESKKGKGGTVNMFYHLQYVANKEIVKE